MCENIEKPPVSIPRFGQGEQLLGAYDLEINNVTKGRGSLLIQTGEGLFMLKPFTGSKEKAEALAAVLRKLGSWDSQTEWILSTGEGEYLVREEHGSSYILKRYIPGRECDVKNPFEVIEGVRKLADLHLCLREIHPNPEEVFQSKEHLVEQEIRRHNRELRNLKNYIRKKNKKTGFEELFWQNYSMFYSQCEKAESFSLERTDVQQLCHGDYHYHNVLDCSGTAHVAHFENLHLDDPMSDLAKYMRKALEKNRWQKELGRQMIVTYDRRCPLSGDDLYRLYQRLMYPEKFWKIANHYNNNKKAWSSKRDGDKLRQIIQQEKSRQEFLELLYNLAESYIIDL